MTEKNLRLVLTVAGTSATIGLIIAIILSLRGQQVAAVVFLVLSLLDGVAAWLVYRQYTRLRTARWHNEMRSSQQKLDELMAEGENEKPPPPGG